MALVNMNPRDKYLISGFMLITSLALTFVQGCRKQTILDKKYSGYVAKEDLDSIKRSFGYDTASLIAGTITWLNNKGESPIMPYGSLLEKGIQTRDEFNAIIREQEAAIQKNADGSRYRILKTYLGHKGNIGSYGTLYVETPEHLSQKDLIILVNEIEDVNKLRASGDSSPENLYYFYHDSLFYAAVSAIPPRTEEPSGPYKPDDVVYVDQYITENQTVSDMHIAQEFDSAFSIVTTKAPFDETNLIDGIYFLPSRYIHLCLIIHHAPGSNVRKIYRVHPLSFGPLETITKDGMLYAYANDHTHINKRIYEINEFGDLYVHDTDPFGYGLIYKKLK